MDAPRRDAGGCGMCSFKREWGFCGVCTLERGMLRLQWELLPDIEQVNKAWGKKKKKASGNGLWMRQNSREHPQPPLPDPQWEPRAAPGPLNPFLILWNPGI